MNFVIVAGYDVIFILFTSILSQRCRTIADFLALLNKPALVDDRDRKLLHLCHLMHLDPVELYARVDEVHILMTLLERQSISDATTVAKDWFS